MGEHTIRGTFGIDTKPAKESVDDLKRHVEQRSGEIKKLISGSSGGAGASGGPPRPPQGEGGGGIAGGAAALAGGVAGIAAVVGAEAIRRVSEIAKRFGEAREEAEALETRIHGIQLAANKSGGFQALKKFAQI